MHFQNPGPEAGYGYRKPFALYAELQFCLHNAYILSRCGQQNTLGSCDFPDVLFYNLLGHWATDATELHALMV